MSDEPKPNTQASVAAESGLPTLSPRLWLGVLLSAGLMALAWYGTFSRIWMQWFPAWWQRDTPLLDRLTGGDSYYTHGPLVPAVSFALALFIYTQLGAPSERTRRSSTLGWAVFGFFLLTHLLFTFASVTFASGFALIGVMVGIVLIWGGWPLARAYALPIALLLFMVPLPLAWIDGINFELKLLASKAALWLATHAFGVPAVVDGSYVLLSPDSDGLPKTLVIENVCGGLRSIIALTYFAALFAALCRVTGLWRWLLLVLALPVAIACNIARITGLIVAAHHLGIQAAGEHGWFHDLSGILVFALALAMMFALEAAILLLGRLLERSWSDARLLGYLKGIRSEPGARPRTLSPATVCCLVVAAGLSAYWVNRPEPKPVSALAQQAIPQTVQIADTHYDSAELNLQDKVLAILETDDYIYRRFTADRGGAGFDLLIVFSKNNRRGTHSPELCIQGNGEKIVSKGQVTVDAARETPLAMREVVSQAGRRTVYYLYVFKCGDTYTTNYTLQQATILLNGLLHRDAGGALIRFTVNVPGQNVDAARELAQQAAARLMPVIDQKLP